MKFDIQLDDEDYINFNIFHVFHSKYGKKSILMGRLLMFFISFAVILIFIVAGAERGLIITEAVLFLIASIIWFIYYPKMAKKKIRMHIYKLKEEGALPYNSKETVEFNDTEIIEVSPKEVIKTNYSEVTALHLSDDYLYLYKGSLRAIIIPYRSLGNKKEELTNSIRKIIAK